MAGLAGGYRNSGIGVWAGHVRRKVQDEQFLFEGTAVGGESSRGGADSVDLESSGVEKGQLGFENLVGRYTNRTPQADDRIEITIHVGTVRSLCGALSRDCLRWICKEASKTSISNTKLDWDQTLNPIL